MKRMSRSEWNRYCEVRIEDARNLRESNREAFERDAYLQKVLANAEADAKALNNWAKRVKK